MTRHPAGNWVKHINGKRRSFGRWAEVVDGQLTLFKDPDDASNAGLWKNALRNLHQVAPGLLNQQDRKVTGISTESEKDPCEEIEYEKGPDISIRAACNLFLSSKIDRHDADQLLKAMVDDHQRPCEIIIKLLTRQCGREKLIKVDDAGLKALGDHIRETHTSYSR
ncbi:hypothetical protein AB1L42_21910 [Thalassoglobus sp. JC818]|uniref:hypothetical protein n=1 Tax=Thalassoglobus sp. JC818 TaxID=3232136 RepID=UPI003458A2E9